VLVHLRQNAHPFRNRVADTPEINGISAGAKPRSFFDQHGLMAALLEQVGQGRSGETAPLIVTLMLQSPAVSAALVS
jgi:hypothetical protein